MATHHFEVDEAVEYGVESAILLNNIRFWLAKNKANKINAYDGFYWTYNSSAAFSELFPYMNRRTISRRLKELCDAGVLIVANYNKAAFDKTPWYTIPREFSIIENNSSKRDKSTTGQSFPSTGQSVPTIPDNKTQIENTDLKTTATLEIENNELKNKVAELEKKAIAAKSENKNLLPDYEKQTADEIKQGQDWLNRFANPAPLPTSPNDIELTPEQLGCFQWAINHDYWKQYAYNKSVFIKTLNKPNGGMKPQYEQWLSNLQAQKNPLETGSSSNKSGTNYGTPESTKPAFRDFEQERKDAAIAGGKRRLLERKANEAAIVLPEADFITLQHRAG